MNTPMYLDRMKFIGKNNCKEIMVEISIGLTHLSVIFGILGILVSGVAVNIALGIREDEKDRRIEAAQEKILEKENFVVGLIMKLQRVNMYCISYENWLKMDVTPTSKPFTDKQQKQSLESIRKNISDGFSHFWDFYMTKSYLLNHELTEHIVSLKPYIEDYLDGYPDIYNLHPISQIAYKLRKESYPLFKNITISNPSLKKQQELMVDYLRWTFEINKQKGIEANKKRKGKS